MDTKNSGVKNGQSPNNEWITFITYHLQIDLNYTYQINALYAYCHGFTDYNVYKEQQRDLDDAREITAAWCGNVKKINFVAVILDFGDYHGLTIVIDKPELYI